MTTTAAPASLATVTRTTSPSVPHSDTTEKRRRPGKPRKPLPDAGSRSTPDPNEVRANSKLTRELLQRVVAAIRVGNRIDVAAKANGVHPDTLMLWMRKGREATRGLYHDLAVGVDRAVAESEMRDLGVVDAASAEQWQAAAWKLERRYPEHYGRRMRHEGQVDVRHEHVIRADAPVEKLEQLRDLLLELSPPVEELGPGERPAVELLALPERTAA